MRKVVILALAMILIAVLPLLAAETKLGKPVDVAKATSIKELLANPDMYLGKDVRIEGEINGICQMAGCWIDVRDSSSSELMRVKVNDGEIEFPKDGKGRKVIAQGKFEKLELSKEDYISQLKHEAEENNRKVDLSKVTGPKTIYRLKGSGAIVQ